MPIGKNAIKRVTNNGYSNTKTSAPDMENSVVVEEKKAPQKKTAAPSKAPKATATTASAPKAPKKAAVASSGAPKTQNKVAAKKPTAPKKSMESEPELAPVKTLEKVVDSTEREGDGYINLGGKLPIYLL